VGERVAGWVDSLSLHTLTPTHPMVRVIHYYLYFTLLHIDQVSDVNVDKMQYELNSLILSRQLLTIFS